MTRRAANDKVHLALPGHALHLPAVVVHPLEHVVAVLVEDVLAVGMVGPVGVGGRLVVLNGPLALDRPAPGMEGMEKDAEHGKIPEDSIFYTYIL